MDPLAMVRWIYVVALSMGSLAVAFVLRRIKKSTGVQAVTLFRHPDVAELLRAAALVGYVSAYIGGTFVPSFVLFRPLIPLRVPAIVWGAALLLAGGLCYFAALGSLGRSFRIGGDPGRNTRLVTRGIYARIRHPIYTSMLIELLGMAVMYPCPLAIAALPLATLGFHVQATREERWWLSHHGDAYRLYLSSTGRFMPRFRRR